MTYFGVLLRFVVPPIILLAGAAFYDARRGRRLAAQFDTLSPWTALLVHVLIALSYTTPWDNYLVATRVWWYDPHLVTGITFGWVPVEEYTFFIVQTVMTGLWLLFWIRHAKPDERAMSRNRVRWVAVGLLCALWVVWLAILVSGWPPGRYMALILVWALPPIGLQLAFGADILWDYRNLVLGGVLPPFIYLCLVDMIAIHSGTWTINPDAILGVYLGGVLPLEEATFFLVTNVLIVFGIVLMLARESHRRIESVASFWKNRR